MLILVVDESKRREMTRINDFEEVFRKTEVELKWYMKAVKFKEYAYSKETHLHFVPPFLLLAIVCPFFFFLYNLEWVSDVIYSAAFLLPIMFRISSRGCCGRGCKTTITLAEYTFYFIVFIM